MKEEKNISTVERNQIVIIALLFRILNDGKNATLKDQIKDLAVFGLSSGEIGSILGKKMAYVSKELSELKKTQ